LAGDCPFPLAVDDAEDTPLASICRSVEVGAVDGPAWAEESAENLLSV
jgi:hypothetical protein